MSANPGRRYTRYAERRARAQTLEQQHKLGDHAEHGDSHCSICLREYGGVSAWDGRGW